MSAPPITPGDRYIVVRGPLRRRAALALDEEDRWELVLRLIDARCAVGRVLRSGNGSTLAARTEVAAAKVALGERGAAC